MKVNYRRTVEKQREAEHQEWLRKRQEKLGAMTSEEREVFLEKEKQDIRNTLSLMSSISSYLGDNPYSKL